MKTRYLPREWKLERFGQGPWMDEPDHAEWTHRNTGMPCIVVRIPVGAWAGYVGVSATHPLYRVSHKELELDENVVVSGFGYGRLLADMTPVEIETNAAYWLFGFDFSHGDDLVPRHETWKKEIRYRRDLNVPTKYLLRSLGEGSILEPAYADFTFVRMRAERLSEQLEYPERIARTHFSA